MTIQALDFATAAEALSYACADGRGVAIRMGGDFLVTTKADCHRLEEAGVEFAFLHDHEMPDGSFRLVCVPVGGDR